MNKQPKIPIEKMNRSLAKFLEGFKYTVLIMEKKLLNEEKADLHILTNFDRKDTITSLTVALNSLTQGEAHIASDYKGD